jgi:TolB-like protein/class 3 adenylate cyclase
LQQEHRRLAAILAADVVGYSRMVRADEAGTIAALKALRSALIDPCLAEHRGRIVKLMGDGLLAEFPSVVDAVRYAVKTQAAITQHNAVLPEEKRISFRVGINLGDVIVDGDDIHGDGVNVAARLEGIADPGGIYISSAVHDQVKNRIEAVFEDLGEREVKNIDEPLHVWRWHNEASAAPRPATKTPEPLPLPDKPSIAVLPFKNMSGDVEQEYFADGMVEEIITALSRARWLFVIARNSSFIYKGRAVDVKQVGRELGVRYVLEGSVRKAGNRVRITGQLVDAMTGAHLWADRFDGELQDVFDLQDQVTASVVGAIAPRLEQAEIERAKRKPTESLDAYDYYLRGMSAFHQWTKRANDEARSLFYKAIELDPNFAVAYAMAARSYSQRWSIGEVTDRAREKAETVGLARRVGELGWDDAVALCSAGSSLVFVAGDFEIGGAYIERSLALNPNLGWAWLSGALVKAFLGETEVAIERANHAMRLSPNDPQVFVMRFLIGLSHFYAGRGAEALLGAKTACQERPDHIPSNCLAVASGACVGDQAVVQRAVARLHDLAPGLRISNLRDFFPIPRSDQFDRWSQALRKAGLSE